MSDDGYSDEKWIDLEDIDEALRPALDMRIGLDDEAVAAYAESVGKLPPVLLIYDATNATHWVVDGRHRITAARHVGKAKVRACIKSGSYEDAYREASRANEVNGLRVTNADKRHRVERALQNGEWEKWSSNRIAKLCGVSQPFVESLRGEPRSNDLNTDEVDPPPKRVDTIGREQPAKKPKPQPAKRLYRDDETPLLDRVLLAEVPDSPYEPPPPFVPPVLDQSEVDWESCWDDVEGSIMEHYNAWPVAQRGMFVGCLAIFARRLINLHPEAMVPTERERLLAVHPDNTASIERERKEDSDAGQEIPTDA